MIHIQRVPRVGFGLSASPTAKVRRELVEMLGQHLSKTFDSVRVFRRILFPISHVVLHSGEHEFILSIGRENIKGKGEGDWCVAVNPRGYPVPLKPLPEKDARKYANDLLRISDEVHALLTSTPGISDLRWYFEGWDVKIPGVRTPAELPWSANVPGLVGTESLKRC